jgi:hypothetical protein
MSNQITLYAEKTYNMLNWQCPSNALGLFNGQHLKDLVNLFSEFKFYNIIKLQRIIGSFNTMHLVINNIKNSTRSEKLFTKTTNDTVHFAAIRVKFYPANAIFLFARTLTNSLLNFLFAI